MVDDLQKSCVISKELMKEDRSKEEQRLTIKVCYGCFLGKCFFFHFPIIHCHQFQSLFGVSIQTMLLLWLFLIDLDIPFDLDTTPFIVSSILYENLSNMECGSKMLEV